MKKGFTLVELLVVITVLSIMGVVVLNIFTNTLRGSNKSQIILVIKQNGQAILESIDKVIRNAEDVVCISSSRDTLVILKEGKYTRYRFIPPKTGVNGQIQMDQPVQPAPPAPKGDIDLFLNNVCTDLLGTDSPTPPQVLTDTNTQTGVSVKNGSFSRSEKSGSKDTVTITFQVGPGVSVSPVLAGQIDPVRFTTTILLR